MTRRPCRGRVGRPPGGLPLGCRQERTSGCIAARCGRAVLRYFYCVPPPLPSRQVRLECMRDEEIISKTARKKRTSPLAKKLKGTLETTEDPPAADDTADIIGGTHDDADLSMCDIGDHGGSRTPSPGRRTGSGHPRPGCGSDSESEHEQELRHKTPSKETPTIPTDSCEYQCGDADSGPFEVYIASTSPETNIGNLAPLAVARAIKGAGCETPTRISDRGRNRVCVEFRSAVEANSFLKSHPTIKQCSRACTLTPRQGSG